MKLKTKKTLAKRVKVTASGKLMRKKIMTSHLKEKLTSAQKSRKGAVAYVGGSFFKKISAMLISD